MRSKTPNTNGVIMDNLFMVWCLLSK